MAIRGILFDKDDTLTDLYTFWRKPTRMMVDYMLKRCGGEADDELRRRLLLTIGLDPEHDAFIPGSPAVAGTNLSAAQACCRLIAQSGLPVDADLAESSSRYLEGACISDGEIVGTADFGVLCPMLVSRGYKLGLATSDNYESALHCLKGLGIDKYFGMILAADRVSRAKPDPETAVRFCDEYGFKPEDVVMVGDSENDMIFAERSGLIGIFFSRKKGEAIPESVKHIITDMNELPELLERL